MIIDEWAGTIERLARLFAHPRAGEVFGGRGHDWMLEPPLTAGELAELEDQLGVRLPEEYRSFLSRVSRGGAGPAYGLFPVRRTDGVWHWEGDGADMTDRQTLARPFAHTDAFDPADGLPEPPDDEDFDSEDEFDEAMEAYQERHDAVAFAPEHSAGLIYLCHLGCAYREAMVVSGPRSGEMWADDRADDGGFRPLVRPDGGRLTFADWYTGWLDEVERKLRREDDAPEGDH